MEANCCVDATTGAESEALGPVTASLSEDTLLSPTSSLF